MAQSFVDIPTQNFSRGMDQRNSEDAIVDGFVEEAENCDIVGTNVRKRRGYKRYAGTPATIIGPIYQANSSTNPIITLGPTAPYTRSHSSYRLSLINTQNSSQVYSINPGTDASTNKTLGATAGLSHVYHPGVADTLPGVVPISYLTRLNEQDELDSQGLLISINNTIYTRPIGARGHTETTVTRTAPNTSVANAIVLSRHAQPDEMVYHYRRKIVGDDEGDNSLTINLPTEELILNYFSPGTQVYFSHTANITWSSAGPYFVKTFDSSTGKLTFQDASGTPITFTTGADPVTGIIQTFAGLIPFERNMRGRALTTGVFLSVRDLDSTSATQYWTIKNGHYQRIVSGTTISPGTIDSPLLMSDVWVNVDIAIALYDNLITPFQKLTIPGNSSIEIRLPRISRYVKPHYIGSGNFVGNALRINMETEGDEVVLQLTNPIGGAYNGYVGLIPVSHYYTTEPAFSTLAGFELSVDQWSVAGMDLNNRPQALAEFTREADRTAIAVDDNGYVHDEAYNTEERVVEYLPEFTVAAGQSIHPLFNDTGEIITSSGDTYYLTFDDGGDNWATVTDITAQGGDTVRYTLNCPNLKFFNNSTEDTTPNLDNYILTSSGGRQYQLTIDNAGISAHNGVFPITNVTRTGDQLFIDVINVTGDNADLDEIDVGGQAGIFTHTLSIGNQFSIENVIKYLRVGAVVSLTTDNEAIYRVISMYRESSTFYMILSDVTEPYLTDGATVCRVLEARLRSISLSVDTIDEFQVGNIITSSGAQITHCWSSAPSVSGSANGIPVEWDANGKLKIYKSIILGSTDTTSFPAAALGAYLPILGTGFDGEFTVISNTGGGTFGDDSVAVSGGPTNLTGLNRGIIPRYTITLDREVILRYGDTIRVVGTSDWNAVVPGVANPNVTSTSNIADKTYLFGDKVSRYDGVAHTDVLLPKWTPYVFASSDNRPGITIPDTTVSVVNVDASAGRFRVTVADSLRFQPGMTITHSSTAGSRYVIREMLPAGSENVDIFVNTTIASVTAGTISRLFLYRYYCNLQYIDRGGYVHQSAAVGQVFVETTGRQITLKGTLPLGPVPEGTEIHIYRTERESPGPYHRVGVIPLDRFDLESDIYWMFRDRTDDDVLITLPQNNQMNTLEAGELGTTWEAIPSATWATSTLDRLVTANLRSDWKVDMQIVDADRRTGDIVGKAAWGDLSLGFTGDNTRYRYMTAQDTLGTSPAPRYACPQDGELPAGADLRTYEGYLSVEDFDINEDSEGWVELIRTAKPTSDGGEHVRFHGIYYLTGGLPGTPSYEFSLYVGKSFAEVVVALEAASTANQVIISTTDRPLELITGDAVELFVRDGEAVPTGLDTTTVYYVNVRESLSPYRAQISFHASQANALSGASTIELTGFPNTFGIAPAAGATIPEDMTAPVYDGGAQPVLPAITLQRLTTGVSDTLTDRLGSSLIKQMRKMHHAIEATSRVPKGLSGTLADTGEALRVHGTALDIAGGLQLYSADRAFNFRYELNLPDAPEIGEAEIVTLNGRRAYAANSFRSLHPSRVGISYPNFPELFDNVFAADVDTFSNSGIDLDPGDGTAITGLTTFFSESAFGGAQRSGIVVALKETSLYIIDINQKAAGLPAYQKLETDGKGCSVPGSVAPTARGIMFANASGIYRLNNDLTVTYAGEMIERMWRRIPSSSYASARAVHVAARNQYRLSIKDENAQWVTFVYDYTIETQGVLGTWTYYTGLGDSPVWLHTVDGRTICASSRGTLVESDIRRDDNDPISMRVRMGANYLGYTGRRKLVNYVVSHMRGQDGQKQNNTRLKMYRDLRNDAVDIIKSIPAERADDAGDTQLSDTTGERVSTIRTSVPRDVARCMSIQLEYENSALDENLELTGVSYVATLLSERGIKSGDK